MYEAKQTGDPSQRRDNWVESILLNLMNRVQQRLATAFRQLLFWPSGTWWGDQCSAQLWQLHGVSFLPL